MKIDRDQLGRPIRTILLATDFLQSSRLALDYAAAFAQRFGARLITVNALNWARRPRTSISSTTNRAEHAVTRSCDCRPYLGNRQAGDFRALVLSRRDGTEYDSEVGIGI
jgi:hypothetical protein